jgi:pyruvate dehydrogenase E2 component (dihydrolipoamide acetyltransferase)
MAETVTMPKLGFDMAEGTLVRWVKLEGEAVNKGEVLAEIETDKATVEVESPYAGIVFKHLVEQKSIVPVNAPIAIIAAPGEKIEEPARPGVPAATEEKPISAGAGAIEVKAGESVQTSGPIGSTPASPLARKMALEQGLDLTLIQGTGPGGRIVRKDVEAALVARTTAPVKAPVASMPEANLPEAKPMPKVSTVSPIQLAAREGDEAVQLDRLRIAIGRRMTEAKQQVPHFYITHEYDMEALMALRKQLNAYLPDEKKLSVNDFIVKAVALGLKQFPNLNASLSGNQIIRHKQINVGIAVAVEGGLLTIVTRQTDQKPLAGLSTEIKDTIARARSGKVRPDDIEGSTFSISNLGMYDVEHFIAIINPPEAAILAVGSVKQVPVVAGGGELKVGTRMKATLSADHRVTDGVEGAQFLQVLAQFLEQPVRLVL